MLLHLTLHLAVPAVLALSHVASAPWFPHFGPRLLPDTVRYVVAPEGTEARYRVREQLARIDFPSDAIGKTSKVEGQIVLDPSGGIVREQSKFTVDLTSLASDSERRDNYVRRNTLQTAQHPAIAFAPTEFRNLRFPLPASGEVTFQIVGEMVIKEQTRPVTWDVTARLAQGAVTGQATTKFTFADFELNKPRVASVLSVDDDIRLELDFRLVPASGATR